MASRVAWAAFGAWIGAFAAFLALQIAGMPEEARQVLGLMFLFSGLQFGALLYGNRRRKEA